MKQKSGLTAHVEYAIAKTAMTILSLLPVSVAHWIGSTLGASGYHLLGRFRKIGLRNLEIAFPDMTLADRERMLKASFRWLGRNLVDVSRIAASRPQDIDTFFRFDRDSSIFKTIERARAEGRGFILLTAHLGNWELLALAVNQLIGPINLLSRQMDNPMIDSMVQTMRERTGNRQIYKSGSAIQIMRILRNGNNIGLLADINTQAKEGVFVPFFGVAACTTSGAAALAIKTNALILPGFAVWNAEDRIYDIVHDPIIEPVNTGDRESDIIATTASFTEAIERAVRKYPEQWTWIHRRWKTRPPGEADLYN